jgi:hypothetical protein
LNCGGFGPTLRQRLRPIDVERGCLEFVDELGQGAELRIDDEVDVAGGSRLAVIRARE